MTPRTIAAMSLICSTLALACHKPERATTAAPAPPREDDAALLARRADQAHSAREAVVIARCQRELRCNTIGEGKRYSSAERCEKAVQSEWENDLIPLECQARQLGEELPDCLAAVHDEPCESPFDTLARVSSCTARQLCVH